MDVLRNAFGCTLKPDLASQLFQSYCKVVAPVVAGTIPSKPGRRAVGRTINKATRTRGGASGRFFPRDPDLELQKTPQVELSSCSGGIVRRSGPAALSAPYSYRYDQSGQGSGPTGSASVVCPILLPGYSATCRLPVSELDVDLTEAECVARLLLGRTAQDFQHNNQLRTALSEALEFLEHLTRSKEFAAMALDVADRASQLRACGQNERDALQEVRIALRDVIVWCCLADCPDAIPHRSTFLRVLHQAFRRTLTPVQRSQVLLSYHKVTAIRGLATFSSRNALRARSARRPSGAGVRRMY